MYLTKSPTSFYYADVTLPYNGIFLQYLTTFFLDVQGLTVFGRQDDRTRMKTMKFKRLLSHKRSYT